MLYFPDSKDEKNKSGFESSNRPRPNLLPHLQVVILDNENAVVSLKTISDFY